MREEKKRRNHENVANWKSLQLQLGFSFRKSIPPVLPFLSKDDTVDDDATCDSLSKMLPSRVRKLDLAMRIQDELLILDLLAKYDGEGRCNAVFFDEVAYRTEFKEILKLWVKLRGGSWTIKDGVESKLRDIIKHITIIFYSKSKDNVKFKPGLYV